MGKHATLWTFLNEIDMDFVTSLVSPRPRWLKAFISMKKRQKNIDKMDVNVYRFAVLTHFCDVGFHRSFDNMTWLLDSFNFTYKEYWNDLNLQFKAKKKIF